jgi:hypothetical protein
MVSCFYKYISLYGRQVEIRSMMMFIPRMTEGLRDCSVEVISGEIGHLE